MVSLLGIATGSVYVWDAMKAGFTNIGNIVQWFGENWAAIFTDVASYTYTVLTNLWTNLTGFFESVKTLLTGGGWDFQWTALEEGFTATLKKLPEIVGVEMSPLRAKLNKELGDATGALAGGVSASYARKYQDLVSMFSVGGGGTAGGKAAGTGGVIPELTFGKAEGGAGGAGSGGKNAMEDAIGMYKRIAGAAAKSPEDVTAANTGEMKKSLATLVDQGKAKQIGGQTFATVAPG
jgi:hypothetical protein